MARYVYLIDHDIEYKLRWRKSLTKPGEEDTSVFIVKADTSIDTIVQEITNRSSENGMRILRICAHGRPGRVALGKDSLWDSTVERFKQIKGRFTSRGRIELHSCSVAKEGNYCLTGVCISGEGWLTKLANFTGVPVNAAEYKQYVDENWAWEGTVRTFYPQNYQVDAPEYGRLSREDRN